MGPSAEREAQQTAHPPFHAVKEAAHERKNHRLRYFFVMNGTIKPAHINQLDEENSTIDQNKRNIWLLILFFIIRIPVTFIISLNPERTHWQFVGLYLAFFIVIAMFIWNNRRNLTAYHLDKSSLFIFLVVGALFRAKGVDNLITLALESIIFLCVVIFGVMLLWSKIKFETFSIINKWNGLAILFGLVFAFFIVMVSKNTEIGPVFEQSLFVSAFNYAKNILAEMGATVIIEEAVFRGFLWGTLRNYKWQENKILIFQAFMFWISHLDHWNSLSMLVLLPIMSLLLGFLAKKSKSILPPIIVHAMYNAA